MPDTVLKTKKIIIRTKPSTTIATIIKCFILSIIILNTSGCGSSSNDDATRNDDPPAGISGGSGIPLKKFLLVIVMRELICNINLDDLVKNREMAMEKVPSTRLSVSFSDENTFAGSASWEWNGGYYICTGATEINGYTSSSR